MSATRSHALDSLRSLAILCVMPFHITGALPEVLQPVAQFGWMGVDLFFVLSGYLIGAQLLRPAAEGRELSVRDFYVRRAWRILPAYLVVLALYVFVPAWRERDGLAHAWQFLSFTLNLNIDYARTAAFSHAWSLCVEEHFYLVLPLIVVALLRRPSLRKTAVVAAIVFVAGIVLRAVALHHLRALDAGGEGFQLYYLEHVYYPTWMRLDGLLAGVLLAATQLFRPLWWQALLRRTHLLLAVALGLIGLCVVLFKDRFESAQGLAAAGTVIGYPLLALGLACLMVSMLSARSPLGRRIPGARMLATLAFSLYLTHKAVFHLVQVAMPGFSDDHRVAVLPVYAGAALVVAWLLYFAVERPCLRMRDRSRNPASIALAEPAL